MTMFEWLLGSPFVLWETLIKSDTPWSFIANEFVCRFIYDIVYRLRLQSTWNDGVCGGWWCACVCVRVCACNLLQYHKRKTIKSFKYMQGGWLSVQVPAQQRDLLACDIDITGDVQRHTFMATGLGQKPGKQNFNLHLTVLNTRLNCFLVTSTLTCQPGSTTC